MCRLFPVLRYGLVAVSLFTILTITINRYIMIGHPRIYPRYVCNQISVLTVSCGLKVIPMLLSSKVYSKTQIKELY